MLMRETILRSGFRSIVELGPLVGGEPRQFRTAWRESRRTAGDDFARMAKATYLVPGIGRVLQLSGDGWTRRYYCQRISAHV